MKAEHSPKIRLSLPVPLQPAKNGAALNQKLGLIGIPPQSLRKQIDRLGRFLQPVQETCQVLPGLYMLGLHLQQVAVRANRRPRQRTVCQVIGLLQPTLGRTVISGRCGGSLLRCPRVPRHYVGPVGSAGRVRARRH